MILIPPNELNCPACGSPKLNKAGEPAPEFDVCFYCYLRGSVSNLKVFILIVLNETSRPVTIYELADKMTAHPINKGRRKFTRNIIKSAILLMIRPNNRLILVGHRKNFGKKGIGRSFNTYKIGRRKGTKYLDRYLDRWDRGKIIHLKQKKAAGIMRLLRRSENRNKALKIKAKMKEDGYDRFEYFMIRDFKKNNE